MNLLEKRISELKLLGAKVDVVIVNEEDNEFQITIKHGKELVPIINSNGEEVYYSSLTDVYNELRSNGIHEAKLLTIRPNSVKDKETELFF